LRTPGPRRGFNDKWNGLPSPLVELPSELFWPLSSINLLAVLFVSVVIFWANKHHVLRYFSPTLALLLVGEFLWIADHHSGMLLVTMIAGIWLGATAPTRNMRAAGSIDIALITIVGIVFLQQIAWSATTIMHDRRGSYDPSSETAHYLKARPQGTSIAAFHFWSTGMQPYFAHNPFINTPSSWWQWSSNITVDAADREVLAIRPDIVVYTVEYPEQDSMRNQIIPLNRLTGYEPIDPILINLSTSNYRETHRFCGQRFDRWTAAYRVCDIIFEARNSDVVK
jgi:hypothetical protein